MARYCNRQIKNYACNFVEPIPKEEAHYSLCLNGVSWVSVDHNVSCTKTEQLSTIETQYKRV